MKMSSTYLSNQKQQIEEYFINRVSERAAFEDLLSSTSAPAVFNISGNGGAGKTWLTLQLLADASKFPRYRIVAPIDFFISELQTGVAVRDALVSELGDEFFPEFTKAKEILQKVRTTLLPVEIPSAFEDNIQSEFIREFNQLSASHDRIVLSFDTVESIANLHVAQWLFQDTIPHLHRTVTIVAGRGTESLAFANIVDDNYVLCRLGALPREDTKYYFERRGLVDLQHEHLERLWDLAKGRPLLMDMAADWLKENINYEALVNVQPEAFQKELVLHIRNLAYPKSEALLYMAWAYRRLDEDMLRHLLNDDTVDYPVLIKDLSQFSFVKYRAPINSFQLHDEARDLIVKHLWPVVDSTFAQRRKLTMRLVSYYNEILLPQTLNGAEQVALEKERLTYELFLGLKDGYENFTDVFDRLYKLAEYEQCSLLLQIISPFTKRLSVDQANQIELRRARIEAVNDRRERTLSIGEKIFETSTDGDLKLDALRERFFAFATLGRVDEADAELTRAHQLPPPSDSGVSGETYARFLSATAYHYRITGRWNRAIELFMEALPLSNDPDEVANRLNTIGYIHALNTDYESAIQYCNAALQLRQQHRLLKGEGLSYSTLGEVHRYKNEFVEAVDHYERALDIFRRLDDKGNVHRVLQQRGICYVLMNELSRAHADLRAALDYYESTMNLRDYPSCLERIARLYYATGQLQEAEKYFRLARDKGLDQRDIDSAVVGLVGLAQLAFERGESATNLQEYRDELGSIVTSHQYQNPQPLGQLGVLFGLALAREAAYDKALPYIAEGMAALAAQRRGTFLVTEYLGAIQKAVDQLPSRDHVIQWCRYLRDVWKSPGIANYHPELVSYCDIRELTPHFDSEAKDRG